jgi:hypothetical protein
LHRAIPAEPDEGWQIPSLWFWSPRCRGGRVGPNGPIHEELCSGVEQRRECDVHHQRPPARVFAATLQCTASYRFADGQLVATGVLHLDG